MKKIFSYLYTPTNNMSKRLNKKTKVLTNILDVDLKHDYSEGAKRYFVNKDKFWEFKKDYNKLQDEKQNPMSV